jgi:hypothetical protein
MSPQDLYQLIKERAAKHRVQNGRLYEQGDMIADTYIAVSPYLSEPDEFISDQIDRVLYRCSWDMYRAEVNPYKHFLPEKDLENPLQSEICAIMIEEADERFWLLLKNYQQTNKGNKNL